MSITKLFGSYGFNSTLDSFNDEMKFFAKMSILDWCGEPMRQNKNRFRK